MIIALYCNEKKKVKIDVRKICIYKKLCLSLQVDKLNK